jgi:hypothetical protein
LSAFGTPPATFPPAWLADLALCVAQADDWNWLYLTTGGAFRAAAARDDSTADQVLGRLFLVGTTPLIWEPHDEYSVGTPRLATSP